MSDPTQDNQEGLLAELLNLLAGSLQKPSLEELLTIYRLPTPIHWISSLTTDGSGAIGGGIVPGGNIIPNPVPIYRVPSSSEAWFNRITITSPNYPPGVPLTTGQLYGVGSSGELVFFLPLVGDVCPVIITESGLAAAHLGGGQTLSITGSNLPPSVPINFELQITLVQGISLMTPREDAPGRVLRAPDIL